MGQGRGTSGTIIAGEIRTPPLPELEPKPKPKEEIEEKVENVKNYEDDEDKKPTKGPVKNDPPKSLKQRIPIIRNISTFWLLMIMGVVVAVVIILTLASLVSVPAGYKGVITSAPDGNHIGDTLDEGWHFNPYYLLCHIELVRYNAQTENFVGSDLSDDNIGSIGVRSSDGLEVYMDFSITYHIPAEKVSSVRIQNGDYKTTILVPAAKSTPRDEASKFTALDMIGAHRGEIEAVIRTNITLKLAANNIIVDQFSLRDIRPPDSVSKAIEDKKVAEQNLITAGYEADRQIRLAEGNMTAMIINANGSAQAKVINANGSAQAIKAIMDRFKSSDPNSTNATAEYLAWAYIQALSDPNSRVQYVILPSGNGTPILLNIGKGG